MWYDLALATAVATVIWQYVAIRYLRGRCREAITALHDCIYDDTVLHNLRRDVNARISEIVKERDGE